ncbi:MAG: glycoside hydrolase family 3 C-terminal domain-containing protein [Oscillospiraceae bacterium]|nr:glycoside hydrolase family 3 C-terminal domain-containing protein [Oscillospiraceae bacterium]
MKKLFSCRTLSVLLAISILATSSIFGLFGAVAYAADDPLSIIESPIPQNVLANADVVFKVAVAGGDEPYSFEWQSGWGASGPWLAVTSGGSGYSTSVLTLESVAVDISGTWYRCVVTDDSGANAESSAAMLQVTAGTTRTAAPTASPGNNSTIGINSSIWLYSNVAIANGVQIFYTTGSTAAETPDPTMASTKYGEPLCVVAPSTPGSFCVKAIATSTNAAASTVATFNYTVNNSTVRLTDVKSDPNFITWKAGHFRGTVPQSVDDVITQVIAAMTTTQRATLLSGLNSLGLLPGSGRIPGSAGGSYAIAALGIPTTSLSDGPAGLRVTVSNTSTSSATPAERNATFWPNGSARSSAWNKELSEVMGTAWGKEQYYFGNDIALAPGQNIHRSVLNGRNFEYYSEDPFLSGNTSAAEVKGFQTQDVGMTVKHFAANNQESNRFNLPTNVSTRALREVYLRSFEYAIEEAQPWSVMTSYNQVNSVSSAQNYSLNTTILRNEWGFGGFVMTDWGGRTALGAIANTSWGNAGDIYPGFNNGSPIASGDGSRVKSGADMAQYAGDPSAVTTAVSNAAHPLTQDDVDLACRRVLQYIIKTPVFNDRPLSMGATDPELKAANRAIGMEIGTESVILLKNAQFADDEVALPLDKEPSGKILSLGLAANSLVSGGTGSGAVNMSTADSNAVPSLNTAIANIVGADNLINTATLSATGLTTSSGERVIAQSLWDTWADDDISAVVYCVKRTSGESSDVNGTSIPSSAGDTGYRLSNNEQNLITQGSAFARSKGIPFIVVLNMGTWVRISDWEDQADAIIMTWEQGMGGGAPAASVIFGDTNPSGKTPTSVPIDVVGNAANGQKLNPSEGQFAGSSATYNEGIFVGYRYYDTFDVPVTYPFGYGLSYTTFGYSDAALDKAAFTGVGDILTASVKITNTGSVAGKEVVQFYIGAPGVSMVKPVKELKGYGKTALLEPDGSQTVSAKFDAMSLASYDDQAGVWVIEPGKYVVYFGASSQDIKAVKWFTVSSEIIVKTVAKDAMSPRVSFTEIRPTQSIITFEPAQGGDSFKKAYTEGAAFKVLPELPEGYIWFDTKTGRAVNEGSIVAAQGDRTIAAMPLAVSFEGGKIAVSFDYANTTANAINAMFIIAQYDKAGRMLTMVSETEIVAAGASVTIGSSVALANGAYTAKVFLWNGDDYVPLRESVEFEL